MNAKANQTVSALACLLLTAVVAFPAAAASGSGAADAKGMSQAGKHRVYVGVRPLWLVDDMDEDSARERSLKSKLRQCASRPAKRTDFSIGHRGAGLQIPEHTRESYIAAARMGAGIVECDVTFTKDKTLVCRHAQCDLHATTNILATDLAKKCSVPPKFDPETGELVNAESIKCCTSDITVAEFKSLKGKMDAANTEARSIEAYMDATPDWRTDLYASRGTLLTHAESIELFQHLGVKMTPELKAPEVEMPYEGLSQAEYAQKMINEYKAAEVSPSQVFPQSFNLDDVLYWIENEPEFGEQAVYLDGRYDDESFDHTDPATWSPSMQELAEQGVNILAPPMWMLLATEGDEIVPSTYAKHAKKAGLDIITWTFERTAPFPAEDMWYYQTVEDVVDNDGDKLLVLDVLAQDVGIIGMFSDWPATVTYYASCVGLR